MLKAWMLNPTLAEMENEEKFKKFAKEKTTDRYATVLHSQDCVFAMFRTYPPWKGTAHIIKFILSHSLNLGPLRSRTASWFDSYWETTIDRGDTFSA